jgi:hypothetical protein
MISIKVNQKKSRKTTSGLTDNKEKVNQMGSCVTTLNTEE